MNISRQQLDKLVVGTNDVSFVPPDVSPTGTAVLNGPVYVGTPSASPKYEAVFNVGTPPPPQLPLNTQPPLSASLGIKLDGSMEIVGDGRVPNALKISGGQTKVNLLQDFLLLMENQNHLIYNTLQRVKDIDFVMLVLRALKLQYIIEED